MTTQERIAKYLEAVPPAIAGSHGHGQTFKVACSLYNGWNLSEEDTLAWLRKYNERCQPPWTDKELAHKAAEAAKAKHNKPRGHLLDASIQQQRAEPDWTLPSVPIAAGKISATLATVKTHLRTCACNACGDPPVIPRARMSENNVANVAKEGTHPLEVPKGGQNANSPTEKPPLSPEDLAEARRIAGELVKLRRDGAIKTAGDASFYANLIRDFDATYAGPSPYP